MYLHYYNWIFKCLFPKRIWRKETNEKIIYLTFDDGPIPEVTDFVLDELAKFEAKATFFCVGDNVERYPWIYARLLVENHRSGNHTYNHLRGNDTAPADYYENVKKTSIHIKDNFKGKELFRPPYGRLSSKQFKLLENNYDVVMWSVLSGDFDVSLSKEKCLNKTIKYTSSGAIVVFHDSVKTIEKLRWVLPRYLAHFSKLGYRFECL